MALRLSTKQIMKNSYAFISSLGELGAGSGSGGGTGGSIRDAGGIFGRMEAAREEQYFRNLSNEQLQAMKRDNEQLQAMKRELDSLRDANEYHEQEMEWHAWVIENNKKRLAELAIKLETIVE
uniref:ATPase inhibitor, mitochondrial n=1 Tax=Acrobeloides nanus TaxID=290746 RepID=A0A914CLB0_9BILA